MGQLLLLLPFVVLETLSTVSFNWERCWWMLSGSLRSSVATLTVADIVGESPDE